MNYSKMLMLLPALITAGEPRYVTRPVKSAREAKTIAEKDTGGLAVSARAIPLNGATGGWVIAIHMPNERRGWRCIVDRDTHAVYTKTRIPNPPLPKRQQVPDA